MLFEIICKPFLKIKKSIIKLFKNKTFKKELLYYFIIIIAGALWGLGQYPNFCFIRFFGLIPFLYITFNRKHYILETLIFGWLAYIINFYWLFTLFSEFGNFSYILSLLLTGLFCLYYALQYPLISFISKKFYNFNKKLIYLFPTIFVFVDFTYVKVFTHTIADSQIGFRQFIQLIDITGMSGLILIIMFFNLGLFLLIKKIATSTKIKAFDFIFILPLLLAVIYGFFRINQIETESKNLPHCNASLIQGNITGKQKRDKDRFGTNVEIYNTMTHKAVKDASNDKLDFTVWPESALINAYDGTSESLNRFVLDVYPPLVMGVTFLTRGGRNGFTMKNSCLMIKNKTEMARYEKKHLLMFGEWIPLEKAFPFLKMLTPSSSNMSIGETPSIFNINDKIKACISICFEDIFPDEIRKKCNEGCNVMINITNDSWYGKGMGPVHHSILARLRAIENRRSFYRCTATGLTSASDPTGRVIVKSKIWEPEIVTAKLPLYEKRTIYSYIGEFFSYLSIAIMIITILVMIRSYFSKKN